MATAKQKIAMLKEVRARIKGLEKFDYHNVNDTGICRHICAVRRDKPGHWQAAVDVLKYIDKALGKHAYLSDWIRARRPKFVITWNSMKFARLQYIDWMIAQYEKQK